MLRFLSKPYPRSNAVREWLPIILSSGLLVALILFFVFSFQNELQISLELIKNLLLFGLVTSACMSFSELLLPVLMPDFFAEEKWTVSKNIFLWLITLALIAVGNMWMANQLYGDEISTKNFFIFLYYTLSIGFVINAVLTTISYNRLTKKFTAGAELMREQLKQRDALKSENERARNYVAENDSNKILIVSENEKEKFEYGIDELLYIESADNYSRIFYLRQNKESNAIIRGSLKMIEAQLKHADLFRCHRTYIVNLKKIISVNGNSQGYRLKLDGIEKQIPVSRSLGKELTERLKTK